MPEDPRPYPDLPPEHPKNLLDPDSQDPKADLARIRRERVGGLRSRARPNDE